MKLPDLKRKKIRPRKSQGFEKLWNYFLAIIKLDEVSKQIAGIRGKYNIPLNGYTPENLENYAEMIKISHYSSIPKEGLEIDFPLSDHSLILSLKNEAENICKEYKLYYTYWAVPMLVYILFNTTRKPTREPVNTICAMGCRKEDDEAAYEYFPISIRISPYASRRDIVDYVEKNYKTQIRPRLKLLQDRNCKIGRIRIKPKKEILDFIEAHIDMEDAKLGKLVQETFISKSNYGYAETRRIKTIIRERKKKL